jgi:hypothetical protein
MSITNLWGLNPPFMKRECVLGYSNFGDIALAVVSRDKRFTDASVYVYESGKLVKRINYYQESRLTTGISTFEYDTDMRTRVQRNIGEGNYMKFEAY